MSDTLSQDGTASLLPEAELEDDVLVRVDNLVKHFPVKAGGLIGRTVGHVQAVDGVSLTIRPARRSASSARQAAGSPRWPAASPA